MSIFIVDIYVIRTGKHKEFMQYIQNFLKYKEKNSEKFKECISWKVFRQAFGDISGAYVEMMEFENMADAEKWGARMLKDEVMTKIREEFMPIIKPATHSMRLWNSVT